ncbi:MAG TPA: alpha-L-arabinofuranosidase [Verrucomicrobiae bacterium]|nr:alpha-L-arabinofuranosidase [Verrucomicrobiae bacterium]
MKHQRGWVFAIAFLLTGLRASGQANLPIYTDNLVNGFQNWSWAANNLSNTSPVHSGSQSISVSSEAWQALSFYHPDFDTTPYTNLTFWINGGAGGQIIQVVGELSQVSQAAYVLPALAPNIWQQITIPLSTLGVADKTNFDRFSLQLTASGASNTFYVDEMQLTAKPAPALVHINVSVNQILRTVDARFFGVNTAVWDSELNTPTTVSLLREAGLTTLRFPGGSLSDEYHWGSNTSGTNTWTWGTSFTDFARVATNIGAQVFITVNYGTGTPAEAAAWVKNANITNHYGFKYWEIGNELYGTWETDSNTYPHDAYTYATRAQQYIQQMKAADPTIKIGVVVTPGETSDSNGYTNHPAYNPRTGQTNYGWTAVLFSTLKSLGVTPDFAIHHRYPEYTDSESDPLLLQGTSGWASDAADLRQQITDYFGAGGTNIELLCTENNSNSGNQGKQSVSLVNGLYYADSLAQLMKTEFNSLCWWDLRNGLDNSGNLDPTLYGWRMYGDIGMLNGLGDVLTNRYPHFFTAKLMQYFARAGDTVLGAASDYELLSAYGARHADGSLSLLVINKDSIGTFTGQIVLGGFVPSSSATTHSYGMPQDNAAQTGIGSCDIAQTNFSGAGTNFNYVFKPYSATVLTFAPTAASLTLLPQPSPGKIAFQLHGQPGVRYVIQSSTNLAVWSSASTNTLAASSLNVTNARTPSDEFWRVVWVP